jgi:anaphase-promoting complex subunit 8
MDPTLAADADLVSTEIAGESGGERSTSSAIAKDYPHILLAKSLISSREYHRCFTTLLSGPATRVRSGLGLFLAYYSMYLAGEKSRDQHNQEHLLAHSPGSSTTSQEKEGTEQHSIVPNPLLSELKKELDNLYATGKSNMDGFLLYLYAVVLRDFDGQCGPHAEALISLDTLLHPKQGNQGIETHELLVSHKLKAQSNSKALTVFMESLVLFPYNWSCWLELSALLLASDSTLPTKAEFYIVFSALRGSSGLYSRAKNDADLDGFDVMYTYFYAHYHIERQNGFEALNAVDTLYPLFPKSNVLLSQAALAHYAMRDYDKAQNIFETIRLSDPYRFDDIDTYSNILHVKEAKADLSFLAHMMAKIDKYSLEYCFVVGNYYSIKGQHEKAILYFHRALRLNNRYLSAWTLMGHECINLKNTAAAVMCYRRAIELSGSDFRAWYGLGQTFEMLHMYQYALYYFQRAAAIKPLDSRNWCAVGICYQKLNQPFPAIQSFEYAVNVEDREGIASKELARLYKEFGNEDGAMACYIKQWMQWGYLEEISTSQSTGTPYDAAQNHNYRVCLTFEKVEIDSTLAAALLFATNYYYRKHYDYTSNVRSQQQNQHGPHLRYLTEAYASLLMDYIGPEGDEARALLRSLRSRVGGEREESGGRGFTYLESPGLSPGLSRSHDMSFERSGHNLNGSNDDASFGS